MILCVGLLLLAALGAIWLTQSSHIEQTGSRSGAVVQRSVDRPSDRSGHDGPRVIGKSPVVDGRSVQAGLDTQEEPVFLSWDFINGLFAAILVLEFVVFPFLFWLWFGPIHKK